MSKNQIQHIHCESVGMVFGPDKYKLQVLRISRRMSATLWPPVFSESFQLVRETSDVPHPGGKIHGDSFWLKKPWNESCQTTASQEIFVWRYLPGNPRSSALSPFFRASKWFRLVDEIFLGTSKAPKKLRNPLRFLSRRCDSPGSGGRDEQFSPIVRPSNHFQPNDTGGEKAKWNFFLVFFSSAILRMQNILRGEA